jgi:ATP-dependent DNA helicase RecG
MTPVTEQSLLGQLIERLQQQEALELEFKSAAGGVPKSLWETVSAFANTNGGWILLGVSDADENGNRVLEGLKSPDRMIQQIEDQLRNPEKMSTPVCNYTDVSVERLDSRAAIVMRVPAAPRRNRPVYINGNPYRGTYLRRHAGDFRANKQEVDRMMRDASGVSADSAVLHNYALSDLSKQAVDNYRLLHRIQSPASPFNGYDDVQFLRAIGAWAKDRERGSEGLTLAGLLMLGEDQAIAEWRPRHLIDYRRLPDSGGSPLHDRWEDRIPWSGNLFEAFYAIWPRLSADQPVRFRLQGTRRVDEGAVQIALREALVNLLVHADYSEPNASLIFRYPEGYLLRNPGSSLVAEADLMKGNRSEPRNPTLVRMFRFIGLSEEAGSGIPKIVEAWRELGLRSPKIDTGTERYEFSIDLRHAHLLAEDDRQWLRKMGSNWEEAEQMALIHARHEGEIDNSRLRKITGLHPSDATKVLTKLKNGGWLDRIGAAVGRSVRYRLSSRVTTSPAELDILDSDVDSRTMGLEGMALSFEGTAESIEGLDSHMEGRTPEIDDVLRDLSKFLPRLRQIATPATESRRLNASVRDQVIVDLCRVTPLSALQLAALIQRHPREVRLATKELLESGELTLLFPDQPRHPKQKYRAANIAKSEGIDPNQVDLGLV